MLVEVAYTYTPIIRLIPAPLHDIVEVAAYNIRDLSQIYPSPGVTASTCS